MAIVWFGLILGFLTYLLCTRIKVWSFVIDSRCGLVCIGESAGINSSKTRRWNGSLTTAANPQFKVILSAYKSTSKNEKQVLNRFQEGLIDFPPGQVSWVSENLAWGQSPFLRHDRWKNFPQEGMLQRTMSPSVDLHSMQGCLPGKRQWLVKRLDIRSTL